jgi:hypothetical protein
MLATILDMIRSVLRADPTISPAERARLLALLRQPGTRKAEAAQPGVLKIMEWLEKPGVRKMDKRGLLNELIQTGRSGTIALKRLMALGAIRSRPA